MIKGGRLSVLGQFRDNESEELFWELIDYVAFGNHEDKARKALEAYLNG